ncbi:Curved DNA-binding protein [Delftia tsuruhatensis]|uniref:DnaJ C-terminal domain-containing protein n=1 Tax=Delftia tsuruhatensis TaxID=180282 RepID=UPI001E728CEC|nr:DnaJ C-terminal domain-containing protein [Delftia tsuruhatensis]CAB5711180.1 Curved DNA-binding protein [Delftia tsuruhatensis]CAC9686683.1 Curved DNA-binding protein [Delftia tsuruhatensis]
MDYKDYYRILGLDRGASTDEIKKAYRKLARKYHPDVSKEADASQRMAEVNEANAVLSDPEKRAAYDALADGPRRGTTGTGGFQPPPGWENQDFHFRGGRGAAPEGDADFSDFFSQMFGHAARARQADTGGQGRQPPDMRGQDQHASIELDLMDSYRGAQRSLHLRTTAIDDDGQVVARDKELQVSIPKGVREGQMIRLAGQGGAGLGKGPAGDLLLEVHLRHDPRWWAEGKDVYQNVALAPWEAALGGAVRMSTIAGEFEVSVPAGSRPGRKLRIKGKGLPAATPGDLYLVLGIALPEAQTDAQRQAYASLAQAFPSFDARRQGTGQGASR